MSRHDPSNPRREPRPNFGHIFVATDFSAHSSRALSRAARLPVRRGGRITVTHVLPDHLPKKLRAGAEKLAQRNLEHAAAALAKDVLASGRREIRIASELCRGRAYVEIIRHARFVGADIIVLGRHGDRPVKDMFIGSTAERVIRAGDLPVLVVGQPAQHGYRRAVVAVAVQDTSRTVIATALRALGPEAKRATIMHAYQVPFEELITPTVTEREMTDFRRECRQKAVTNLARLQRFLDETAVRWETALVRGDPRLAILSVAARRRADLVVLGTHGRSGLSHALLGSVAEWVIRAATCDVLVAHTARVSFELP